MNTETWNDVYEQVFDFDAEQSSAALARERSFRVLFPTPFYDLIPPTTSLLTQYESRGVSCPSLCYWLREGICTRATPCELGGRTDSDGDESDAAPGADRKVRDGL